MLDAGFVLDAEARRRLIDRFGPGVEPWCAQLPALVEHYGLRWGLELDTALSGGTSRLFAGWQRWAGWQRAGRRVILKLTPDPAIADGEARALSAWAATPHAVNLLDSDPGSGVLLLEELTPGTKLSEQPELPPLTDVADLLTALRNAPPVGSGRLPSLSERVDFLFSLVGRHHTNPRVARLVTADLVYRSRDAARILAVGGPAGLVHGDLHPGNVLDAGPGRGLVAIDPRPCVGDPDFDAVDWALARAVSTDEITRRIACLGDLVPGLDTGRVWRWCTATAVIIAIQQLRFRPPSVTTRLLTRLAASP